MGETVEESGCHLGVTEDRGPFTEGKIGGDNDRSAFVMAADEMEQELPSSDAAALRIRYAHRSPGASFQSPTGVSFARR
jgi:hypothetical protein